MSASRRPPRRPSSRPALSLALQGGGAHGAYTWGVLDALLEADAFEITAVSGAGAGAVNAMRLAEGFSCAGAGPAKARAALRRFWTSIGQLGSFVPGGAAPEVLGARTASGVAMSSAPLVDVAMAGLSPCQLDPLSLNPLPDMLFGGIDFEAIRTGCPFELRIAATRVRDGRARLFTANEALASGDVAPGRARPTALHVIDGGRDLARFGADGQLDVDPTHLRRLFELGTRAARAWMGAVRPGAAERRRASA